jgi:NitT/TauT family transport system permease protein
MRSQITSAGSSSAVPSRKAVIVALRVWGDRLAPAAAFVGLIVIWEGACRLFAIPSFLLPSPSAIVRAGLEVSATQWLGHISATLRVALMGYAAAIAISIPLAVALVNSRFLSRTLYPILVIVQSTPIVAVARIIVVTLGAFDLPRVVITFLIAFFPIVVSTVTGLMVTPEELIELSRSLRAGRTREMLHIRLPFAVPYIFSALKISITLSIIGAVVAEFVAAERGLGFFIMFSTSFFKIPQAFAGLAILVALSLALFRTFLGRCRNRNGNALLLLGLGGVCRPAAGKLGTGVARQPEEDEACSRGRGRYEQKSRRKIRGVHRSALPQQQRDFDDQSADRDAGGERKLLRHRRYRRRAAHQLRLDFGVGDGVDGGELQ